MPVSRISEFFGFGSKSAPLEQKSVTLTDPAAFELFGIAPTRAGFAVGPESAMRVPAVACAVGLIAATVGTLPPKIYQHETKESARNHPAYRLIHDEANEWTSASQLRTDLTVDALLRDNGYAKVVRYSDGRPFELHRLDPSKVTLKHDDATGEPVYIVQEGRKHASYPYTEILHIQPFGGKSPIKLGRDAISLSMAFEAHIASLFANGGRPSGIIKSEKTLGDEAKKKVAASWFKSHGGTNSGGTAILDEGMDYQQLSMTLTDAQFAENRLEQVREIARHFRVPPTMLFELTRGTWSNTEEMARQFYTITLKPWLSAWAWAYSRVLLTPEERESLYVEFVTDDLLTTNAATRAASYGQYRSMGAMTANEVRSGLNLPPHKDGESLQNPYTTTAVTPAKSEEVSADDA
ncbi:phage portal protein [Phyllobacterium bourgognense]|uniref:HK97 family phage portal protein n=1 Tax=Phyllobacterium bourgognense TaxID=314236 RepID=A0A368YZ01_9HYPH|nr:phage portal protein [Phyllobacterium bourgognense]RCW85430.1 HK97 family phage portal protein [Phyllobacterium bourgognense]